MAIFVGTFTPRIDDKGRFFLPARFREELSGQLYLTIGQEDCLLVYPAKAFNKLLAELEHAPDTVEEVRRYKRQVGSFASDEVADKQGRVGIPSRLRHYAKLEKDIVVIGVIDHLEIWNPEAWKAYSEENLDSYTTMDKPVYQAG
jgi:MraZ protein